MQSRYVHVCLSVLSGEGGAGREKVGLVGLQTYSKDLYFRGGPPEAMYIELYTLYRHCALIR